MDYKKAIETIRSDPKKKEQFIKEPQKTLEDMGVKTSDLKFYTDNKESRNPGTNDTCVKVGSVICVKVGV